MLASWLRILPLFLVERIARKYGGRINQGGATLICGPKGTYFHEQKPVSATSSTTKALA